MTQEEKQLLLKDLCMRLSYDVNAKGNYDVFDDNGNVVKMEATGTVMCISKEYATIGFEGIYYFINCRIDTVKPYLRPMQSMTEVEKRDYAYITERWMYDAEHTISESIDWLNERHFDHRGLIDKGLALEAQEGMYNN